MARSGLRIIGRRGNQVVARACIRYARWLRRNYDFPIRVPVYLLPGKTVRGQDGGEFSAMFFAPFRRDEEPYIRIATGDYGELRDEVGRDNALGGNLHSLSHEIIHYMQWVEKGRASERGVERAAWRMVDKYAETRAHP